MNISRIGEVAPPKAERPLTLVIPQLCGQFKPDIYGQANCSNFSLVLGDVTTYNASLVFVI